MAGAPNERPEGRSPSRVGRARLVTWTTTSGRGDAGPASPRRAPLRESEAHGRKGAERAAGAEPTGRVGRAEGRDQPAPGERQRHGTDHGADHGADIGKAGPAGGPPSHAPSAPPGAPAARLRRGSGDARRPVDEAPRMALGNRARHRAVQGMRPRDSPFRIAPFPYRLAGVMIGLCVRLLRQGGISAGGSPLRRRPSRPARARIRAKARPGDNWRRTCGGSHDTDTRRR